MISSEYPPNLCGGLGTHVANITAALADRISFDVLTPAGFDHEQDPRIRIHPLALTKERDHVRVWLRFCEAAVACVEAERLQFDYIHCHDWMTAMAGVVLRVMTGRPLVVNVHLPQKGGETFTVERLALAVADRVIVNSIAMRRELERRAPSVSVIPNGVDPEHYRPRADWPVDEGYILFVGRLVPQKGAITLIEAMAALLRRASARLVIAGDGLHELYLRRAARNLGCADRVTFAGWARGDELVQLYQGAQFVVMPSIYEPFGIVALEAMACGRAVIASACDGLEEIIEDGVSGVLVPPGDPLRLAARMLDLLENPQRRAAIGMAARARALQYKWTAIADQTLRVLDSLQPSPWKGPRRRLIRQCARDLITTMSDSLGDLTPVIHDLGGANAMRDFLSPTPGTARPQASGLADSRRLSRPRAGALQRRNDQPQ